MVGGHSSAVGIVFYDTSKNNENAVFCRYEGNEAVFKTGEKDELLEEMKKLDKVFPRTPTGFYLKAFGLILLIFSLFVAAVWKFIGGFFPVFGAFVFYIPKNPPRAFAQASWSTRNEQPWSAPSTQTACFFPPAEL